MLLYKNWQETWPRLLLFTGFLLLFSTLAAHGAKSSLSAAQELPVLFGLQFAMFYPVILSGSGISTQQSFRPGRGLHGSTLFTLSLPVTRFRLLATRSVVGIVESCFGVAAVSGVVWTAFPVLRVQWPLLNLVEFVVADSLCLMGFYFMCVVIAAIVEDVQFQIFLGLIVMFLLRYASMTAPIPPSVNVIRAMGAGSPLITHAFPWASVGISLGASVIFFLIALKIVQSREY